MHDEEAGMSTPTAFVQKLWNYCNILRDDGLSYGDYVEQLAFLLFLKMADEQSRPPFNEASAMPKDQGWPSFEPLFLDESKVRVTRCLSNPLSYARTEKMTEHE